MSILEPIGGELFEVTVHKRLINNPEISWVNTYTLLTKEDATSTELETAVDDLAAFEQEFLNNTSEIYRTKHWQTGTQNQFKSIARSLTGSVDVATSDPLDLEFVLLIARTPAIGRVGVSAYRDCLTEGMVARTHGETVPNDPTALSGTIDTAVTNNLEDLLESGTAKFVIVKYTATGNTHVAISSIDLQGIGTRDKENRWFNRSTT